MTNVQDVNLVSVCEVLVRLDCFLMLEKGAKCINSCQKVDYCGYQEGPREILEPALLFIDRISGRFEHL